MKGGINLMAIKQLFNKTMHFENPSRLYIWHWGFGHFAGGGSQFWQSTIDRWYNEGLPKKVNTVEEINRFFKVDNYILASNIGLYPPPRRTIIEENEEFVVYKTGVGSEVVKDFINSTESSMMQHISYPFTESTDWAKIKGLLSPDNNGRYSQGVNVNPVKANDNNTYNVNQLIEISKTSDKVTGLKVGSLYGWIRNWLGIEEFAYKLIDEPNLIEEMFEYITDSTVQILKRSFQNYSGKIDFAIFWEDMAFKTGPLFSPEHFKHYMVPRYKRITEILRNQLNIDVIMVDSDGNIEKLIPLWLESGINCVLPLEVAAGMDVARLRKEYGKDLLMIGGIDKRVLATSKENIRSEIERILPVFESGGYIPAVDHSVPPDISFDNYLYFHNLLLERCNKICKSS